MTHPKMMNLSLEGAADIIKNGGLLIFPTETFFGMGSRALDADATARIFRIKRRSNMRPLPLIAADEEQLDRVCRMPQGLMDLVHPFWPGPLSVVVPARLRTPDIVTGCTGKVAVRISSHPICHQLACAVGEPFTASSANISGKIPVTHAEDLDPDLLDGVDGVLDVLPRPEGGAPSTLIEPLDDPHTIRILRAGVVSIWDLEQAGFTIIKTEQEQPERP